MRNRMSPFLLSIAASAIAILGFAGPLSAADEECAACHEDVVKAFAKTNHGRTFAADDSYSVASCASCHAGAQEHAASGGETKPVSLTRGDGANSACLSCHAGKPNQAHWEGSSHQLAGLACASCHSPHHDGAAAAPRSTGGPGAITRKCLECHGEQRVAQLCVSCHQQGRHQTVPGVPNSIWVNNRSCLNCHSQVHGTNHPSGPLFQR